MRFAHHRVDAIGKVAQTLSQGHHAQAFALSTPMQQGVERGAQPSAHRGGDTDQLVRQLVERVAQANPRRAPGNRVRILLTVLSKPSVRAPFTWYEGSWSRATWWNWS
jgi:hypothetical protein